MSNTFFVNVTSDEQLVRGEYVEGKSVGYHRRSGKVAFESTWAGVYQGIQYDPYDGDRIHMFKDGHINGHPQPTHGFPVDQYDGVE